MSFKLLVLDIDGTLMGRDGRISHENKRVLEEARSLGLRISLSTARAVGACWGIIEELELQGYHIFFDGALVENLNEGKEVYIKPLKMGQVKEAIEFARLNDIHLELHSPSSFYIEHDHWSVELRRQLFRHEPMIIDLERVLPYEKIVKMVLMVSSAEEIAKAKAFEERFDSRFRFSWAMTPSHPEVCFVNVLDPEVSKGKALEFLASYLGVPLGEVCVVGDAVNDISLFERAGLSIAMGNAPDEVKAKADYVTLDVDEDGLAEALKKLVF